MKKALTKKIALLGILGLFALSFTSCQREGCPGMITKGNPQATEALCSK